MNNTSLNTFHADVQTAEKPVIVDFWSPTCPPCRQLLPVLTELSNEGMPIFKVSVDTEQELTSHYRIEYLPTLVLFNKGQEVARLVGMQSKETIINFYAQAT